MNDEPATAAPDDDDALAEVVRRRAGLLDADREVARERRHSAGRLTARESIADLLDPGSWVEYGGLAVAAQRSQRSLEDLAASTPADGVVVGTGRIGGAKTAVVAYDYTVIAGTQGLTGHRKTDRLLDVAARERLPLVLFAEGGGGRPNDTDHHSVAALELMTFAAFARYPAPRVGVAGGYCFAGNAALFGMCDVTIGIAGASIGMGGPAMIDAAGLGHVAPGEVGPMDVQLANGVVDIAAEDDDDAIHIARRVLGCLTGSATEPTAGDQSQLRDIVPANRRRAYDVRAVLVPLFDTGSVIELRAGYARSMVTALARLGGRPVGVIANNPLHAAGSIDAAAATKAAWFLRLCDRRGLPVVSLVDTPGIMVGPGAEGAGLVRAAAELFTAGASLRTPLVTVIMRKAYGLGAMAMSGGSLHASRLTLAWPTTEIGAMGLEGAVRLGFGKALDAVEDVEERQRQFDELVALAYERGAALSAAASFELDDVIDPADTREILISALL
jgi:acetyl-CoA carboxylase carboxyltransferase component